MRHRIFILNRVSEISVYLCVCLYTHIHVFCMYSFPKTEHIYLKDLSVITLVLHVILSFVLCIPYTSVCIWYWKIVSLTHISSHTYYRYQIQDIHTRTFKHLHTYTLGYMFVRWYIYKHIYRWQCAQCSHHTR